MFGLFDNKPYEPLDFQTRKWYEHNFSWLLNEFKEPPHHERKIFLPVYEDFPITWDGSEEAVYDTMVLIAQAMGINPNEIKLEFYEPLASEWGGDKPVLLKTDEATPDTSGLYFGKDENGQYMIAISRGILMDDTSIISTLSHELTHVLLLGNKGIEDEHITDLATILFGYGVFGANACFRFTKDEDRWGYHTAGYMRAPEWSYALALSAFVRGEKEPEWKNYLNRSIKKDFERDLNYLYENQQEIFRFDEVEFDTNYDKSKLACPSCHWQPDGGEHWECACGHAWDTFQTDGKCPACHFTWATTDCPKCGTSSTRLDWLKK